MPDPVITENTPVEAPPQTERERIYAQYYGEAPTPTPEAVVPVEHTPPPVAAPVVDEVAQLKAELEALRASVAARPQVPSPEPVAPPAKGLVDYLREGDISGFENALAETVEARVAQKLRSESVGESLEMFRVETAISNYLDNLRRENPDLVPMERYLKAPVEARIEAARQAGRIQTGEDFVRAYRESVEAEVGELRKYFQKVRASGKEDALTVRREIVASGVLEPNAMPRQAEQSPSVDPSDYLKDRLARSLAGRNLTR